MTRPQASAVGAKAPPKANPASEPVNGVMKPKVIVLAEAELRYDVTNRWSLIRSKEPLSTGWTVSIVIIVRRTSINRRMLPLTRLSSLASWIPRYRFLSVKL